MAVMCSVKRSVFAFASALAVFGFLLHDVAAARVPADEQSSTVQKLFEEGSYQAVLDAVNAERKGGAELPESTYLAAQALLRMEQVARATAEYSRLRSSGPPAWRLVAESGAALAEINGPAALSAAQKAVAAEAENPWAQYQLGLAASKQVDFGTAVRAFERCVELKPDFAYAHYYAALAYQKQRKLSESAEHFEVFLRLAPKAPERPAVLGIMRTLK